MEAGLLSVRTRGNVLATSDQPHFGPSLTDCGYEEVSLREWYTSEEKHNMAQGLLIDYGQDFH